MIFCQSKQKSARIVDPIRKIFVTNDGKASVDSPTAEYLEVPLSQKVCFYTLKGQIILFLFFSYFGASCAEVEKM